MTSTRIGGKRERNQEGSGAGTEQQGGQEVRDGGQDGDSQGREAGASSRELREPGYWGRSGCWGYFQRLHINP